jgi:CelD/BcsL family acetyltransferase involved in cellulose biosynthesis
MRNLEMTSKFAPSAPGPLVVRARVLRCPDRFELNVATAYHDRPDILEAWQRMLAGATGPETLYQSPQFFNHLIDTQQGQDANYELFIVRRSADYAIVGFIPVRTIECGLEFRVGPVPLFKRTMRACQILGSVPLLDPAEEGLADYVMQQLLERYAKCDVLYMQAVPEEGITALDSIAGASTYVLNGWRPCHTQPLPDSVDGYLRKFNSKKRYNLSRQVRLLAEAAGTLQLLRIEAPDQVAAMLDAMAAVDASPDAERAAEQARLESLARHGLLLSYVIRCGDEDVAVVYGARSASVWHIYKIACQQKYLHLSVGTSAIHLAVQDVLAHFAFKDIDFGYGTPNAEFRSTHVLKKRGLVLLHRARSLTALLLKVHGVYNAMNDALIHQVKRVQKWHAQRQQAARKAASKAGKAPTVS